MPFIIWILIIVFVGLFAFWPAFRTFVRGLVSDILRIIDGFARIYSVAAVVVLAVVAFLVLSGLFAPWGTYKGLAFGISAALVYAIWAPAGVLLRIFRINTRVFPMGIRAFAAWLCFIGFLGVLYPDATSNFKLILLAALAAGVFLGVSTQWNALQKLVIPVVIVLSLITLYKYIWPDSYRAHASWLTALGGAQTTATDRGRIRLNTYSAATYGRLLQDTKVAYVERTNQKGDFVLMDTNLNLKKDTMFLLVNHKDEILEYRGQAFVQITLRKPNGSFLNGTTVWVEADLIEIGSRSTVEVMAEEKPQPSTPSGMPDRTYATPGTYPLNLAEGQESGWITIKCHAYNFASSKSTFIVKYESGAIMHSWDGKPWLGEYKFKVLNCSKEPIDLIVI